MYTFVLLHCISVILPCFSFVFVWKLNRITLVLLNSFWKRINTPILANASPLTIVSELSGTWCNGHCQAVNRNRTVEKLHLICKALNSSGFYPARSLTGKSLQVKAPSVGHTLSGNVQTYEVSTHFIRNISSLVDEYEVTSGHLNLSTVKWFPDF